MSRHSKNNTSQSIFTYGQKQKLKGEYGHKQERISQDSIKKFEMCTICNNLFIEPVCCSQGHIFCKSCAIQYLVRQKKKIAQAKQQIQLNSKRKQQQKHLKKIQQDTKKAIQFEKHDNFENLTDRKKFYEQKSKQQKDNEQINQNEAKPVGVYEITSKKQKYVKSSFWATENTTQVQQKVANPSQVDDVVKCPAGSDHKITLKKLRPLHVKKLEQDFSCYICNKEIRRQKIGSYKCGHIVCLTCKSEKCQICGKKQGWIELQSSSSSFAQHKKAEVKTYTHAFYI